MLPASTVIKRPPVLPKAANSATPAFVSPIQSNGCRMPQNATLRYVINGWKVNQREVQKFAVTFSKAYQSRGLRRFATGKKVKFHKKFPLLVFDSSFHIPVLCSGERFSSLKYRYHRLCII